MDFGLDRTRIYKIEKLNKQLEDDIKAAKLELHYIKKDVFMTFLTAIGLAVISNAIILCYLITRH